MYSCDRISGSKPPDALNVEWKTYSNSLYSISYPEIWTFDNSGENETIFFINSAMEGPEDRFNENISLAVKDLSGLCVDLAVFTDMTLTQTKKNLKNANFTEVKKITGNNGEFQSVVFSGEYEKFDLKWKQYYKIIKDKAYILTFASEKEKYDSYSKVADRIFNSFKIMK